MTRGRARRGLFRVGKADLVEEFPHQGEVVDDPCVQLGWGHTQDGYRQRGSAAQQSGDSVQVWRECTKPRLELC
jgi:hypothetical protein